MCLPDRYDQTCLHVSVHVLYGLVPTSNVFAALLLVIFGGVELQQPQAVGSSTVFFPVTNRWK